MGFFNVPRGPADWGDLLYQPTWADEYRTNPEWAKMTWVHAGILILMLVFVIVFLTVLLLVVETFTWIMILVSVFTLLFFIRSAFEVRKEISDFYSRMPPRIYEKGVTLVKVPFKKGYRKEEELVPFEKVVKVRMEDFGHHDFFGREKKIMTLVYTEEDGAERMQAINNWVEDEDDISPYVRAIHNIDPHLIDDEIMKFIDPLSQDLERYELPSFHPKRLVVAMVLTSIVVTSIIAIIGSAVLVAAGGLEMGLLVPMIFIYPVSLGVGLITPHAIERNRFRSLLLTRTHANQAGLQIDLEGWNPLFLSSIKTVPLSSIKRIELNFTPALRSYSNIVLSNGQIIFNPQWVFREFAELEDLEPVENHLNNPKVSQTPFPHLPKTRRRRLVQTSLLYLLMILVSGLVSNLVI